MNYGFKPYISYDNKPAYHLFDAMKINIERLKILKTNAVQVIEIAKSMKINYDIDELNKLIHKYIVFKDFIIRLNQEFDKYCCLIEHVLREVFEKKFDEIYLHDFFDGSFYLDI